MSVTPITTVIPLTTPVPAMVWCQLGGDDVLRRSPRRNAVGLAVDWPPPKVLRDRASSRGPSIAGRGRNACMAWQGPRADRRIWFSRQNRPVAGFGEYEWGPQMLSPFTTGSFPSLATFGTRMFMFWADRSTPRPLMRWSELRGETWVRPTPEPGDRAVDMSWVNTNEGVAAATHNGRLYIAWMERVRHPNDSLITCAIGCS